MVTIARKGLSALKGLSIAPSRIPFKPLFIVAYHLEQGFRLDGWECDLKLDHDTSAGVVQNFTLPFPGSHGVGCLVREVSILPVIQGYILVLITIIAVEQVHCSQLISAFHLSF